MFDYFFAAKQSRVDSLWNFHRHALIRSKQLMEKICKFLHFVCARHIPS